MNRIFSIRTGLRLNARPVVLFLSFILFFSPLFVVASTPIDSEVKTTQPHWYAFASYFEVYPVEPSQNHISQVEMTFKGGKLPSSSRVNFYLIRHITAVKPVESVEELRAYQTTLSNISKAFTDQSTQGTNPITSWAWDIDNNGTTDYTSQNPSHQYSSSGTYSVKLTVSDGTLNDSETKVNYIIVSAPPSGPSVIQDLSYSYDAVGNITQIVDASQTSTAKTTTYTYDDLHRLTSSTVTNAANGDNTGRTYTYNAIGNILTASDQGTYLYEGTSYANPHAVTKVGSAVYAYDNNGNLTSDSLWTNTWDYANRMTQSQKTGSTVTYEYDHTGQRTKYNNGTKTIKYANRLYNTDGTTATKHIFAGDQLVATIEGASTLQYIHTDHLTGSNVATNSSGGMIQLLDYQPYGAMRVDWKSGSFDEARKFTNHEFDRDTNLTYANTRYYKQNVGRFLSEDPVFLAVGDEQKIKQKTGMSFAEYLQNPQAHNSYAYSNNNPLKHVDKSGNFAFLAAYAVVYAPVWVPAVITAGAGIAASLQAKFFGEGIGHLIEGNQQGFEQAVGKQQVVVAVSALGGMSILDTLSVQSTTKQGGAYSSLQSVEGKERHHIPAQSVSSYSSGKSPALLMDREDHWATKSWGSGRAAQTYRTQQQKLIDQGRFSEAQQMDINDIRSQFGNKYDQGIKQATQYTKGLLNKTK